MPPEEHQDATLGGPQAPGGQDATPAGAGADAADTVCSSGFVCAQHGIPLEPGKITLEYQGHTFPVEVLCCPVCGEALIPEDMAKGRIQEVEKTLEEK